jgi:dipeptidyl aminopeptidase/acylaminoacyl peptidase
MFGTDDIPRFDVHEIGGTPFDNPEEYRRRSPVTYLPNVKTPVLLVHHEGDLRCPIGQSEEIFQGLKMLGKEVEFVRYPSGFHTVNTHAPSQQVDRMRRTRAWYDSHAPSRPRRAAARTRSRVQARR